MLLLCCVQASTGDLADTHDVLSVITGMGDAPAPDDITGGREWQHHALSRVHFRSLPLHSFPCHAVCALAMQPAAFQRL